VVVISARISVCYLPLPLIPSRRGRGKITFYEFIIDGLSKRLGVPKNYMFIGTPVTAFPTRLKLWEACASSCKQAFFGDLPKVLPMMNSFRRTEYLRQSWRLEYMNRSKRIKT